MTGELIIILLLISVLLTLNKRYENTNDEW